MANGEPPVYTIRNEHLDALQQLAERAVLAGVARSLVPSDQFLELMAEVRRLRSLELTRGEARAALYCCKRMRVELDGAHSDAIAALDAAIEKLAMLEIVGAR